jgi:Sep-tRNA:Cys-tRNA synthetase
MDIRTQKLFEALFALEDIRELMRETAPAHDLGGEQKQRLEATLADVRKTLDEFEGCRGGAKVSKIAEKIDLREIEEDYVNINPIQAGGRLTAEARKALIAYGDGYSVCDYCLKPFRLDKINKPPIAEFYGQLAEFVNMDTVRVVRGARGAFQIVANTLLEKGDVALIEEVGHYSIALAIEAAGAEWKEIPTDENNIVTAENTAAKIEAVKKESGKLPKLVALSHVDYQYGNLHPIEESIKAAKEYGIPTLYNGAYTVGVMPVDGRRIGADFVVGSGHKSMAAPAPTGILATTEEMEKKVFATTETKGDVSGRKFGIKEVQLLGCTVMGAPLIAMMASFPKVKERVKHWDNEVEKANYFASEFLKIEGCKISSEMPRKHTLTKVDSTGSFDKVAQTHKKKGYFLYDELEKRKITGIFPGATREYKLNTFGLSWEQIKYLSKAFKEIAEQNGIKTN